MEKIRHEATAKSNHGKVDFRMCFICWNIYSYRSICVRSVENGPKHVNSFERTLEFHFGSLDAYLNKIYKFATSRHSNLIKSISFFSFCHSTPI